MRRLALLSMVLLGCDSAIPVGDGGTSTGTAESTSTGSLPDSTTSAPAESSSTGGPVGTTTGDAPGSTTSSIAWETEGADEGYATTGGCGFTCPQPPGPGGGFGCDFSEQDCFEGETCMPWSNDGSRTWTSLRCVPVPDDPDGLGEPCQAEGSFLSGVSSCGAGLWCGPENAVDTLNLTGVCHQLCNAGACPDGTTCVVPGMPEVGVCQELCDPLTGACPGGQACMPAGFGFACHIAELESVQNECNALAQCGPGSVCVEAPQCGDDGERCCADFCDTEAPDCPGGQSCTSLGSPLSAYDTVGFCGG